MQNVLKKEARPFLKWAGGKTQLIKEIEGMFPKSVHEGEFTYIEPFVGSGAVFFWAINKYPNIKKAIINDVNGDLINAYRTIATSPNKLIPILATLQSEFHLITGDCEAQKAYYYQKRSLYNRRTECKINQAALFIFINHTCFNGLYRVNQHNGYNVPMGSYKNPTIYTESNIMAVSKALQKVEILCGDFEETLQWAKNNTLFYFDPPYKPITKTASFQAYAKDRFNDQEQIRLKNFCRKIHDLNYSWILSNSDTEDCFFDKMYGEFKIERVNAKRSINSNPAKRGVVKEILVTNACDITKTPALSHSE